MMILTKLKHNVFNKFFLINYKIEMKLNNIENISIIIIISVLISILECI